MIGTAFPYGPKWSTALVGLVFSGGMSAAALWLALSPKALATVPFARAWGLPVATAAMWVGGLGAAAIACASTFLLFVAITRSRAIILGDRWLVFPYGIFVRRTRQVPYASVLSVDVEPLGTKRALRVRCQDTTLLIVESMLQSPAHLDQLREEIRLRARIAPPRL